MQGLPLFLVIILELNDKLKVKHVELKHTLLHASHVITQ